MVTARTHRPTESGDTIQTLSPKATPRPMCWLPIPAGTLVSIFGAALPVHFTQREPKPGRWLPLAPSLRLITEIGQNTVITTEGMLCKPSIFQTPIAAEIKMDHT